MHEGLTMEWNAIVEWLVSRYESVLRLMLAAALGGMIGLEREVSGKPAGFRTNLLICLGAALIMELSIQVAGYAGVSGGRGDPGRIGAQIVSGIGFLGAGTILHFRGAVSGLTTAATLWVVAAIGMAVGARAYLEAIGASTLVMFTLMLLGRVEDHLIPRRPAERTIDLVLNPDPGAVAGVENTLIKLGFTVDTLSIDKRPHAYHLSLHARGDASVWDRAMRDLVGNANVQKVELT
jgi:putative Mg2+ transporter-C (MgtC) family protein